MVVADLGSETAGGAGNPPSDKNHARRHDNEHRARNEFEENQDDGEDVDDGDPFVNAEEHRESDKTEQCGNSPSEGEEQRQAGATHEGGVAQRFDDRDVAIRRHAAEVGHGRVDEEPAEMFHNAA